MPNGSAAVVQKLWNYCNVLRDAGLSYGDYLERLNNHTSPPHPRGPGHGGRSRGPLAILLTKLGSAVLQLRPSLTTEPSPRHRT
jgi:hypothetical protein